MKVLKILGKILAGLFLFYLVLGFIIIPLVLMWAIPSQGSKILKTSVHLRGVTFNPLMLQLTMKDLKILDHQNQEMIGFDQLFIDVSFIDLLKKKYHVENVQLDGLSVNVELLPGNQVNLLGLMPSGAPSAPAAKQPVKEVKQPAAAPMPLPTVIVDSIVLHNGKIHFTDQTITPNFSATLSPMELSISHLTTNPQTEAKIKFHSNLDEKGRITMEMLIIPLAQPLQMEMTMNLNDYALRILTPYIGKYTGRELHSGQMDLQMDYRIGGNKLTATHKLMIQQFQFGNSVASKDALHLPFGLAVALLEDPDGKISINLPVSGDMSDPKFKYSQLVLKVVRNFFLNLVTKPFSFLASGLGGTGASIDELGYVRFKPGKADLTASQRQKLITLIKGLRSHPKLRLEIDGSYDPQADWKEIQADSFNKDFAQLRKISSKSDGTVYQMLYQRRFGIRALWSLAKKYKQGIGEYNDAKLDAEIKRQLIEDAPPDTAALNDLAQARAKLVHDFFVTSGFDPKRLGMGHPQATQSSMGYVPLPFTLTVFDK